MRKLLMLLMFVPFVVSAQSRGVYPTDTKFIEGTPSPAFPVGCPLEQQWLNGLNFAVGTRDVDQFTRYQVTFPVLIGSSSGSTLLGRVNGYLAHPVGAPGAPSRVRVWTSVDDPFPNLTPTPEPVLNKQGEPVIAQWCGGGEYELWSFSVAMFAPGTSTNTLLFSSSVGLVSIVAVWGEAF